jgi:tetratricopeptide (TPR) repeat protein
VVTESAESDRPVTSDEDQRKARTFFDHGAAVAGTGNYDYGIEMYLQGLALDPENIEAHQALRDVAMKRTASGGRSKGMFNALKLRTTKDEKQNMLNRERLLAFEPGNLDHMAGMMQAAAKAGFRETVLWIGPILLRGNLEGADDFNKYMVLKNVYQQMQRWDKATEACQQAVRLRPMDMDLATELKNLGARQTMKAGNYEQGGSFRDSIRDREGQEKLQRQDADVRSEDQMSRIIRDAEAEWRAEPEEAGKIMKLVEAWRKTETPEYENKAIDLLQQTFDRTKQFRFRLQIGEIKIRQMSRLERSLRGQWKANPKDPALAKDYREMLKDKYELELAEFQLAAQNYPTEMRYRYEAALRLFELGRYDQAIPALQEARRDPKYRHDAATFLGRSFLAAGFADEAADTLKHVIEEYPLKNDSKHTEMTYWYGRALEDKKDIAAAVKSYSTVAQADFNYRDVQVRIKRLRSGDTGGAAASSGDTAGAGG